jgi:hypothetical protein
MIRIAALLACALVAAACGSSGTSGPKAPPPAFITAAVDDHPIRVSPDRRFGLVVDRDGILQVVAHTSTNDVSYYARLRLF